ncbi:hypothetical protein KY320_01610 [Candidatus Woesearchaeota archaeon]|nr:hypothetical protein [Candidatus Woesearchaeota archaeon]
MAISFTEAIIRLEALGLTDMLLPFLLIFTLVFAVLDKAKVFGKEKKNINMIVSLVIALLVVIPHVTGRYPPGGDVVEIINSAIPNVSVFIVAIVMLLIMIGVFGVNVNVAGTSLGGIVTLLAIIIIGVVFANSAGWFNMRMPSWLGFLNDPDTQALIVVLLMFGVIVAFVTGGGDSGEKNAGKGLTHFFESIGKSLGKVE